MATNENPEVRIVIADDHPIFRRGLKEVIDSDPGLSVVGEASDGNNAIELINSMRPDIAILDIDMPGKNGFEVARYMQDNKLQTAAGFLTMYRTGAACNSA